MQCRICNQASHYYLRLIMPLNRMDSFKQYLQRFPHFTPEAFEAVLPKLSVRHLSAGEYFLQEGKVCRIVGFIESGLLRHYYLNDGKEVTNCFCRENTLVTSYRSLITQQTSDIAIQAVEDSTLLVLSEQTLHSLYEQHLFWQQLGRMAAENELIATEGHHRFINDLPATDRYLQVLANDKDLLQRVPLNYLASYLQVSPETLSRIRKKTARN